MEEQSARHGVGERLRLIVKTRGETLKSFSERTKIPYRTLQNYVSGSIKPNAEQLTKIALVGVDVNYLLTGKAASITRMMRLEEPMDDDNYRFYADNQIMDAVARKAAEATNAALQDALKEGSDLTYERLQEIHEIVFSAIVEIIKKAGIPFADARKLGMSVDRLLASVADVAVQSLAVKLGKRAQDHPLRTKPAQS